MGASSAGFHEAADDLSAATKDMHRAIVSLMEELEAVDWYQQRVDAAGDDELRAILAHNRDEEIEHAAMVLEWIRRRNAKFDEELGTYLNTTGSVLEVEGVATGDGGGGGHAAAADADEGSLRIGSLKGSK
ncbi:encapsulin-associated ferritin-like protein [Stella sp.]|uniref:encapsulin-associated ferritin-like protein n=1 Tax=Stella sp. TaxID=2912054 RepID=UPI0035B21B25